MPLSKDLAKELFRKYAIYVRGLEKKLAAGEKIGEVSPELLKAIETTGVKPERLAWYKEYRLSREGIREVLAKSYNVSREEVDDIIRKNWYEAVGTSEKEVSAEHVMRALHGKKPTAERWKMPPPKVATGEVGKGGPGAGEAVMSQLTAKNLERMQWPELPKELAEAVKKAVTIPAVERAPTSAEVLSRVYDKQLRLIKNLPKEEAAALVTSEPTRYRALPSPMGVTGTKITPTTEPRELVQRVMSLYKKLPAERVPVVYERAVPTEKSVTGTYFRKQVQKAGIPMEEVKEKEWTAMWKAEKEKGFWKDAMSRMAGAGFHKERIGETMKEADPRSFFFKMVKMYEDNPEAMAKHPVYKRFINRIKILKTGLKVGAAGAGLYGLSELYPEEAEAISPKGFAESWKKVLGFGEYKRSYQAQAFQNLRHIPKDVMESVRYVKPWEELSESVKKEHPKSFGIILPVFRTKTPGGVLGPRQFDIYLRHPSLETGFHEIGHALYEKLSGPDKTALRKIYSSLPGKIIDDLEIDTGTKLSNAEELFASAVGHRADSRLKSKYGQAVEEIYNQFPQGVRDIIKKAAPLLGVGGAVALAPEGEAEAQPILPEGVDITPLKNALAKYTGATPLAPPVPAKPEVPFMTPETAWSDPAMRALYSMGLTAQPLPPKGEVPPRTEGFPIDPLSTLLEAAGAGPGTIGKLPGVGVGPIYRGIKQLYEPQTEKAFQFARKLWYLIPGMEKAWKTSLTKMEEQGMKKAANLFRQRLQRIGVQNVDIDRLSSGIYRGLNKKEEAFATEILKSEPGTLLRKIGDLQQTYGINPQRGKEIIAEYVTPVREIFKRKGFEAVVRGLLKDEVFKQNIETYLPRMYWTKEIRQILSEASFRPIPKKIRLDLERFMKRSDIPENVRVQMQEINQLSYITHKGLRQITHDTETMRLFQKLSANPNWTRRATRAERLGGVFPKEWTLLPKSSKLGPLSGKMVRTPIAEEINEVLRIASSWERGFNKYFLTPWKWGKTVARFSTHARNIVSNFILNDLGGLSPVRMDVYGRAIHQLMKRSGREYQLAVKYGILDPTWVSKELAQWGKFVPKRKLGDHEAMDTLMNIASKTVGWPINKMSRLYQGEEQLFKLAKFMHNLDKGMPYADAATDAMKWTFNYGEITPFIRKVKTYAMPFATFTYKALPIVAETAIKHPLRLAKYPLAAIAGTGFALQQMGFNERDWNRLKRVLPMYMRRGHFMLLPYKDNRGRLQFLDLTYVFPWGDIAEFAQSGVGRFMQNPALTLLSGLAYNQNFAGQKIYHDWEHPVDKATKIFRYLWQGVMPSYSPMGTDWESIATALKGETKKKEALNIGQSLLKAFAGAKITPIVPRERFRAAGGLKKIYKAEATREFKRELREHPSERGELRKKYREQVKRIYKPPESILGRVVGSPVEWAKP